MLDDCFSDKIFPLMFQCHLQREFLLWDFELLVFHSILFRHAPPPPHSAPAPNFPSHYHLLILSLSPYMFFSLLQDTTLLSVCTNRYMSLILYLYFLFYFLLSLSLLTPPPNPPPPPLPSSYYLTPPLYAILIFTRYNSFI